AQGCQDSQTIVRVEQEERVDGDEDEGERLVEGERSHVALDPADLDIRPARAVLGALEHRGAAIQSDDVMAILCDRHRDPAGPAAELEDRLTRSAREYAEPLDVQSYLERS